MRSLNMISQIPETSRDLADQIHSAAIHLLRRLRHEDGNTGLNTPRLSALSVIIFAGPLTLGDLAAAEQVRPPTMTRIVDALVDLGLAIRSRNALDGRSVYASATTAGKKLLMRGRLRRVEALANQIVALSAAERDVLQQSARILQRITKAL
jgi:DNA-binding MarR family transcriptional regulator